LTGLPTTSGAVGTKEAAPKQAVADADADLQARSDYVVNFMNNFTIHRLASYLLAYSVVNG